MSLDKFEIIIQSKKQNERYIYKSEVIRDLKKSEVFGSYDRLSESRISFKENKFLYSISSLLAPFRDRFLALLSILSGLKRSDVYRTSKTF